MPQNWKDYSTGFIALLAIIGVLTLGGKFFGKSDTSDKVIQSILPKSEKTTEKVRLLVRSEENNELNEPIGDVSVEFAVSNGSPSTKKTSSDGYADIEIPAGVDVRIYLNHKDYLKKNFTINSSVEPGKTKDYFLKRKAKQNLSSMAVPSPSMSSLPDVMISGEWKGKYTCALGVTGVTVAIVQTGNKVIADFLLYPVPENPTIPSGQAKYEGDFNPVSRSISFPMGKWINQPGPLWKAFGFYGKFDENLETFSGKVDYYSCKEINLIRKEI